MSTSEIWLTLGIVAGFLVVFPTVWCGVVSLLSFVGGWRQLSKSHGIGERSISGKAFRGVTGMVGAVSYRHTLTVHVTEQGFFLEVMPLFRIFHPPLFVAWAEISERSPRSVLWWKCERLSIGRPASGSITLPQDIVKEGLGERSSSGT